MMKTSEMIRMIEKDGWQLVWQTGSHRVYRHPIKPGAVIVPAHGSKELLKGTETSMASPSQSRCKYVPCEFHGPKQLYEIFNRIWLDINILISNFSNEMSIRKQAGI